MAQMIIYFHMIDNVPVSCIDNTMVADHLVKQEAKASAT